MSPSAPRAPERVGGPARPARLGAWALAFLLLAGCAQPSSDPVEGPAATFLPPVFDPPAILDPTRSGGEPVLFLSPTGTLFYAAHPGYTHVKAPPGPEVLTPTSGTSYLWRSEDDGATWQLVTGATENTPRSAGPGVSDPDLAANEDGSILVWTDLEALLGVSTAASRDDGLTWPAAEPVAAKPTDGSVDRPWLTYLDGTFYLLYNGDGNGHWRLRASEDGVAWRDHSTPGDGSYPGALLADPLGKVLYVGNGDKVWWSEDGGLTFTASPLPTERAMTGIVAQRPAVDDAGTVYFAWSELDGIYYASSKDHARTWSEPVRLFSGGAHVWPWPVGGAAGRLAIVWLGTADAVEDPTNAPDGTEWYAHLAMVDAADTATPRVWSAPIGERMHSGAICLDGTFCEAELKDRRLGDFISAVVGRDGTLHIGYGTTETGHSISSPGYMHQTAGWSLRG